MTNWSSVRMMHTAGINSLDWSPDGQVIATTGVLRIGGNGTWSNEWFAGLIDEVRVYNKALTAAEITADMAKPVN